MPLARILVDGYSFLHSCPEVAPKYPRYSIQARDELIHLVTQYHDATGALLTIVFDGVGPARGSAKVLSTPEVEVLFSHDGQTADDVIERVAHRLKPYGTVLVVTDDHAEQETAAAVGAMVSSCAGFLQTILSALSELKQKITTHNRRERHKFRSD